MTCQNIRYALPDFVDARLSDEEQSQIIAHLASCEDCRREAAELKVLFSELQGDIPWPPPGHYWNSLLPRIHQSIEEKPALFFPEWVPRFAPPLASAILLAVAVVALVPRGAPDDSAQLSVYLHQLHAVEIQQVAEQQRYAGVLEPMSSASELAATSAGDKEVLRDLLQAEEPINGLLNVDAESTVKELDPQHVDEFVSILETKYFSD
ncbi:MAG: zf-HC2 domain-containing protein [Bacteroidota bacterium]|jgi:anti-sigma factor RsiW